VWWVGVVGVGGGGGFPLRSNIPRSALCATLDTYNLIFNFFKLSHAITQPFFKLQKSTNMKEKALNFRILTMYYEFWLLFWFGHNMHFSETTTFCGKNYKNDICKKRSKTLKLNDIYPETRLSGLAKKHIGRVSSPQQL
jgi:hypothetical protein